MLHLSRYKNREKKRKETRKAQEYRIHTEDLSLEGGRKARTQGEEHRSFWKLKKRRECSPKGSNTRHGLLDSSFVSINRLIVEQLTMAAFCVFVRTTTHLTSGKESWPKA